MMFLCLCVVLGLLFVAMVSLGAVCMVSAESVYMCVCACVSLVCFHMYVAVWLTVSLKLFCALQFVCRKKLPKRGKI